MNNFLGLNYPYALVAKHPLSVRDRSRLLHGRTLTTHKFYELENLLEPGDLLVFNDSKVMPARLYGHKSTGGKIEILISSIVNAHTAEAVIQGAKGLEQGKKIIVQNATIEILAREGMKFLVHSNLPLVDLMQYAGHVPLPPYLKRPDTSHDRLAYQSTFSRKAGSCAAPTASLHFTKNLLDHLKNKGVQFSYCTLHVGLGTFLPIKGAVNHHTMHQERYEVPPQTIDLITQTKSRGNRVIAVGTTVVRALETFYASGPKKSNGYTEIFIKPGFNFQVVDALITNFHQPDSTLILLVQAFAGKEQIKKIYAHAFKERYRLLSYGDAVFLEKNS